MQQREIEETWSTEYEKTFANHISNNGPVSKIYEEHLQFNTIKGQPT
jgi:hypothetical protein